MFADIDFLFRSQICSSFFNENHVLLKKITLQKKLLRKNYYYSVIDGIDKMTLET